MRFTKGVPAVLSNFTFGQYYRADSVIHRMDPRFKLPELIAIIVFIFVCRGFGTLAIMVALVLAVFVFEMSGQRAPVPVGTAELAVRLLLEIAMIVSAAATVLTGLGYLLCSKRQRS